MEQSVDQYMRDVQFWSLFAGNKLGLDFVYWYYCTGPAICKGYQMSVAVSENTSTVPGLTTRFWQRGFGLL